MSHPCNSVHSSAMKTIRPLAVALLVAVIATGGAHAQKRDFIDADPPVTSKQQAEIIDSVTEALNAIYVFPDVAKEMEKVVRKNYKKGKYKEVLTLQAFTRRLTEDLRTVSHDLHLGVRPDMDRRRDQDDGMTDEERFELMLKDRASRNFGFQKIEMMPGNVGYLDLRGFNDASYAGKTAIAAMNFLANSDALIIDLRQNGGGSPSMIQLISSYFFDEPEHLNSFYIRKTDETQQFWTQATVSGPRMTETPIYVLTSDHTFSAAEEFTYNLKNMKRATIVGETTGGGAHPVEGHYFPINGDLQISMSLPYGRAINPITKTNWEGTGVEPDIKVTAAEALDVAYLDALNGLMETNDDPRAKSRIEWAQSGLQTKLHPVTLDEQAVEKFTGLFGPRKISFTDGALYYQREDGPKFRLTPMGDNRFMLEKLERFRIQFDTDLSGKATRLVGQYSNGRTDSNERSEA